MACQSSCGAAAAVIAAAALIAATPTGAATHHRSARSHAETHPAPARARAAAFDARNPKDVFRVLSGNGATASWGRDDEGAAAIDARAGKLTFQVQFYRCNPARTQCAAVVYQAGFNSALVSLDQVNRWNRGVLLCPAYLTESNHPHAWLGVLASAHDTPDDVAWQQSSWLTCLTSFDRFTDDPEGFLKVQTK